MRIAVKKFQVAVIGSSGKDDYKGAVGATDKMMEQAKLVGLLLAQNNIILVTGGKSGIMEAAAMGAKEANGITIGVVKGKKRFTSNKFTDIEVVSGAEADGFDEFLLVTMSDALIVIGGGAGTLEEIVIAYRNRKPVLVLDGNSGWGEKLKEQYLDERNQVKILSAKTPEEAVNKIMDTLKIYD